MNIRDVLGKLSMIAEIVEEMDNLIEQAIEDMDVTLRYNKRRISINVVHEPTGERVRFSTTPDTDLGDVISEAKSKLVQKVLQEKVNEMRAEHMGASVH